MIGDKTIQITSEARRQLHVDMAEALRDQPAKSASIGVRVDGNPIFYPGELNVVFGEPESGKTWLALHTISQVLQDASNLAVMIDLDHNGPSSIGHRLIQLGVSQEAVVDEERFRYYSPDDEACLMEVVKEVSRLRPSVVVIDSIGELLPLLRANSMDADDFTRANRRAMTPLISSGSCVIAIDHVPKSVERRSKGPIGTSAKRRATGGSMIQMETVEAFIPGRGGIATLTLIKDRHGHVRALTDRNDERIGMFRMETSENGFIDAAIDATAALLQTYAFRPEGKVAATMEELVEQARELFPDEVPTVRELRNALRISNGRANDVGRLLRGDTTAA